VGRFVEDDVWPSMEDLPPW